MLDKIGKTAGAVWEILAEKGELPISQIPKTVNEKQDIVYQAVGWLAREGKIIYSRKKNSVSVSLSDQERDSKKKAC